MKIDTLWFIVALFAIWGIIGIISTMGIISRDMQLIQIFLLIILNGITFSIAIWTAFYSPQAVYAKIQKSEYIDKKRQEHYKRLRDNIFEPFSSKIATITPLSSYLGNFRSLYDELILYYDINPLLHNPLFNSAVLHLDEDFSNMSNQILSLNSNIRGYNDEITTFIKNIIDEISEKIHKFADTVDDYPPPEGVVHFPRVLDILKGEWWSILNKQRNSKKPLNIILADIKPLKEKEGIDFYLGGEISISGHTIMKNMPSEKVIEIVSIIESYRTNKDIISELIKITNKKEELIEKSKEIANKCKEVSELILKGGYETIVDCCLEKNFLIDF